MELEKQVPADSGDSLEQELLRLVARQVTRVPVPIFISAAIITSFASSYVPVWAWTGWFMLAVSMLVVRWVVLRELPEQTHLSTQQRLRKVILLNGAHGITYGLTLAFFPHFSALERTVQTILLLGQCVGAVSTTAGYRPIFYVFLFPVILPLALVWALSPGHSETQITEYLIALIALMFGGLLVASAKDAFRLFKESFDIRLQQVELNQKLQYEKDRAEAEKERAEAERERAEAASIAKSRFLAAASHDLRQPIHALSLLGEALNMQALDAKSREIAGHMNTALQVLATQFDALLDISKLDADIVEVNRETIDVGEMLDELGAEMQNLTAAKGIELIVDCPENCFVHTDESLLQRILQNLVANAVKYTARGRVEVSVEKVDGTLSIEIADTGCGIEAGELEHIFEEFYQVDNPERDRSKGLGLGLAIVARTVELLGLDLSVSSVPGEGSKFTLTLEAVESVSKAESDAGADRFDWQELSVLVVDDQEEVRQAMRLLLDALGCRVELAEDIEAALQAAQRGDVDLALVDFRLRGSGTGIQAIEALQAMIPGLPAILISGDTAPDRLREAHAAGLELLHKPVSGGELEDVVRRLFRGGRGDDNDERITKIEGRQGK